MIDNKELLSAKEIIYDAYGASISNIKQESENTEYSACSFLLNGLTIKFRAAKITPTKNGLFVTLWKRNKQGITQPFEESDPIDLFVINARKKDYFGQFVFPKSVLCQQGIVSTKNKEGKRGIRVYPPWDIAASKQAQKTQEWQLKYFIEADIKQTFDISLAKKLYKF